MERKEFLDLLASDTYDFLRTDKHLGKNIMMLVPGGSHSYGTSVDYIEPTTGERYVSDVDIRGITWEGQHVWLGLKNFEQFENKATDTTIYGLRKITSLLLNCNPNVIEILGCRQDHILKMTAEGQLLRDNANLFLSRRAVHSFGGYATAQLRRLENALARDSYPQDKKEEHIMKSIQANMEHLRTHYAPFSDGAFEMFIAESMKEDMDQEIFLNINLKNYPFRDFKNIFSEMGQTLQNFGQLTQRNKKKDEIHLNKHAMHLIRLFLMGQEILEGRGINTYREKDRELLLKIRFGEISHQEIFDMVKVYEKDFNYAKENSPLPANPDYNAVEELVMEINLQMLRKAGVI